MTLYGDTTWRRAWAVLALATALVFTFVAGPGHAEIHLNAPDAPAGAALHHPGDADAGDERHVGGAHCGHHCGGHVAATPLPQSVAVRLPRPLASPVPADAAAPVGTHNKPLTPPPNA